MRLILVLSSLLPLLAYAAEPAPMSLLDAYDNALYHDPSFQTATYEFQASQQEKDIGLAPLLPQVGLNGNYGSTRQLTIHNSGKNLDEAALQAAHEKLAALKIHPREQTENRTLLARAERLYTQRLGDERQAIGHRIAIFTAALDSQDKRLIREAAQELQDYLNHMDDAPWD